ncbi:MAG: cation-transporting P-type ATPase, partial [candidate division WOR-3 bacterium]
AWNPENMNFFLALALSNDAWIDREGKIVGDPTEIALYSIARDLNFKKDALSKEYPRIAEIPFDSNRKCMTTFHRIPDGKIISYTKGALEALAEKSSVMTAVGNERNDKKTLLRINQKMAERGLRVLGIAMREWDQLPSDLDPDLVENNLKILGMVGMADPPREEVRTAIEVCKEAGIVPVMITGDHPITARSIALQLQITEEDSHSIVSGKELEALPVEEFEKRVEQIRIYARVAPEQKLKIVKSLQKKGQFVAMTGDGVNDAPALKRADIGIAMGIMGTDVAKEASHMILLDDNFATIVTAVKEGRRIFDNIRKFIKYLMTSNSGEIYTLFFPPFLGLPLPLLPIHLLWINLVTDGAPALALSAEPEEADIMRRPPRLPGESLFAHGLGVHIIWVGLLMAVITIFTQYWSIHIGDAHWQTMVFTVLCFNQMAHVLAIRSEKTSLFTQGIFSNKPLFGAVLLTFLLQLCVIYLPFLQPIFKTQPLTLFELSFCCILSSLVFFAVEIEKLIKRSKDRVKK